MMAENTLEDVDPFDYSVQDVILVLGDLLTAQDAESLRSNDVDGCVLLKTASHETLKKELDIVSLGRRVRIMTIVCALRRKSKAFTEYASSLAQDADPHHHLPHLQDYTVLYPAAHHLPQSPPQPTVLGKRKRKASEPPPLLPLLLGEPSSSSLAASASAASASASPSPPSSPSGARSYSPSRPPLLLWQRHNPLFINFPSKRDIETAQINAEGKLEIVHYLARTESSPLPSRHFPPPATPASCGEPGEAGQCSTPSPVEPVPVDVAAGPSLIIPAAPPSAHVDDAPADMSAAAVSHVNASCSAVRRLAPIKIAEIGQRGAAEGAVAISRGEAIEDVVVSGGFGALCTSVRRLAPTKLADIGGPPIDEEGSTDMEISDSLEPESCEIGPTSSPTVAAASTVSRKGGAHAKRYLAPKGRTIESLLYDVPPGDQIPLDYDKADEFQLVVAARDPKFPGEQRYVGRRICRLLKDNGQILADFGDGYATGSAAGQLVRTNHQGGRLRAAIKHYSGVDRYLRKYQHQSFTVFDVVSGGVVHAHRETTKSLHLPWPSLPTVPAASTSDVQIVWHADQPQVRRPVEMDGSRDDNSLHDFDYLLKWQNIDGADVVLPVFGESDDEDEYDEQTWREYQAEFGEKDQVPATRNPRRKPVYLTKEEVEAAIELGIQDVVQTWREKVRPRMEAKDAYRLWRRTKKDRSRKARIAAAHKEIHAWQERLARLKAEFLKVDMGWSSANLVRKQVRGSMGPTIYDCEDRKWLIDLMGRKEQPPKPPPRRPKTTPTSTAKAGGEEPANNPPDDAADSESIGSTSDLTDSEADDGMDGFIVADPPTPPQGLGVVENGVMGSNPADSSDEDEEEEEDDKDEETAIRRPSRRQRPVIADSSDDETAKASPGPSRSRRQPLPPPPIGEQRKGKKQQSKPEKPPAATRSPIVYTSSNFVDLTLDETPEPEDSKLESKGKIPVVELVDEDGPDSEGLATPLPKKKGSDQKANGEKGKVKGKVDPRQRSSQRSEPLRQSSNGASHSPSPGVGGGGIQQKRFEALQSFLHAEENPTMSRTTSFWIRDLDSEAYEAWFHNTVTKTLRGLPRTQAQAVTPYELELCNHTCRLYMTWLFYRRGAAIGMGKITKFELSQLDKVQNFRAFTQDLVKILRRGESPDGEVEKAPVGIDNAPSDVADPQAPFPLSAAGDADAGAATDSQQRRRPKRRGVVEDQTARTHRDDIQRANNLLKRRRIEQERKAKTKGEVIGDGKILLNGGHYANFKDIYARPEGIGNILKPHQVEGIQFLWAQLILLAQDRGKRLGRGRVGGALLAHTMGLGKTLQV